VPSSVPLSERVKFTRKPLLIVATDFLLNNEVLVRFSDGSAAIYEAEELEKLRPTPKQTLAPDAEGIGEQSLGSVA
jgi:hypothetical protein